MIWDAVMSKSDKDVLLVAAKLDTKDDSKGWKDLGDAAKNKLYVARYGDDAGNLIIKAGGEIKTKEG